MTTSHSRHRTGASAPAPAGEATSGHQPEASDQFSSTQERLAATFNSLFDPYVILRAVRSSRGKIVDFEYTDANEAALEYNQTTREELIGTRFLDLLPGHKKSGLFEKYVHTVETGEPLILFDLSYDNEITGALQRYDMSAVKLGDSLGLTWRDVTASKRAFEEYRLLAENASDVVIRTTLDGTIEWVSPSVFKELGWRSEGLVGKTIGDIAHPDYLAERDHRLESVNRLGRATFPIRFRTEDGVYRSFSLTLRNIEETDGVVAHRVGSLRNIEGEIEALQRLSMEHEILTATLQSEIDPHIFLRAERDEGGAIVDFTITDANEAAATYLEQARDDLIGSRYLDVVGHHRGSGIFDRCAATVETGAPLVLDDVILPTRAKGSERHFDLRVVRVGDLLSYTWRDVTDWRATLDQYRLLAENAADVVFQVSTDFVVEWVSPSVAQLTGLRTDEVIGEDIADLVHPDDLAELFDVINQTSLNERNAVEVRLRTSDGSYKWAMIWGRTMSDELGNHVGFIGGASDNEIAHASREALSESENRFRLLAENATDVIFQSDVNGTITWISPSVYRVLGWRPSELVGREGLSIASDEDAKDESAWRSRTRRGERVAAHEVRVRKADGEVRWMSVQASPILDPQGNVAVVVVALRDCQAEVQARRALLTLSLGGRVLMRAEHELQLLKQMCEIAVDEGGYRFAWYGRKTLDPDQSVAKLVSSEEHRDYLYDVDVSWGDNPRGAGPTGRAIRSERTVVTNDLRADERMKPWIEAVDAHGFRSSVALPVFVSGELDGALTVYAAETGAFDEGAVALLEDLAAELGYGVNRLRDAERLAKSLSEQTLLTSAIEQAGESIVVADPMSNIIFANPAALRSTGYSLDELIGENPRVFQSGVQSHEFYEEMWRVLTSGQTWRGVLVNRKKDGTLFEEDTTISPIHDADGTLIAYVAVKHDLTVERRLQADLSREQSDRSAIVGVMRELRPGPTLVATAGAFCEAATRLTDVDAVCVVLIEESGGFMPIAASGTAVFDLDAPRVLYPNDPEQIARVVEGPMLVSLEPANWIASPEILERVLGEGIRAVVLSPVRWQGMLVGALVLATKGADGAASFESRFEFFEELGSFAGTLFGDQARVFENREELRNRINEIIDQQLFHPVFQPFIDLSDNHVAGYEALTRFDDEYRPDQRFMEAHKVGLGSALESACVKAALEAAHDLGSDAFLSVNFSPTALLDGSAAATLAGCQHNIVIEITEHARIDDYAAVREAVDRIEGCSLAVDDAGAGYTSLRHIIELRPDYIKLDMSIVRNIDTDKARASMAAGMCYFAAQSGGTIIIAEGIETEAEAEVLRSLGVEFGTGRVWGQGFLFAKAAPFE